MPDTRAPAAKAGDEVAHGILLVRKAICVSAIRMLGCAVVGRPEVPLKNSDVSLKYSDPLPGVRHDGSH